MNNLRSPYSMQTTVPRPDRNKGFKFQNFPLKFVLIFLIFNYSLFVIWPINWPIYNASDWFSLTFYVALCFSAIGIFYRVGITGHAAPRFNLLPWRRIIVFGALIAIFLLFPSSYLYTGRWPWQVLSALQDQGEAYKSLQYQLVETTGQRAPVAIVRAIFAPFSFAVLPLGILYWRRMGIALRGLVIATVICSVIFSTLRGTDREFADLFIVGGSALLISIARGGSVEGLAVLKRYWKPAIVIILFISIAAALFGDRKSARLGGYDNRYTVCANDSSICTDIDAPLVKWLPLSARFSISFFVLSTTSGYYGLAIAREKDFRSTYGVGHSPAALAIYTLISGDNELPKRTFTYRNSVDGWSDENYWSSLITWIANDVGFTGAVFVMAFLGFLWGRSWRDAVRGHSDAAAVMFCLVMMMLVYLPANNQVFGSYDGYTIFFFWLVVWLWRRNGPSGVR